MSDTNQHSTPAYVRDDRDVMGTALSLARRLPPTGRKPAEYSLARGVMAYEKRVNELVEQYEGVTRERDEYLRRLDEQVAWRQREEVRAISAEEQLEAALRIVDAARRARDNGDFRVTVETANIALGLVGYDERYPSSVRTSRENVDVPNSTPASRGDDA